MNATLTVATRRGELAAAQTRIVVAALQAKHPDIEIRIREVTTAGDRDRRTALWDLKDTGFFTSRLEDALLSGEADVAVHSFKDLPTEGRDGLAVTAVCDRRWPEDCLVCRVPVRASKRTSHGVTRHTGSVEELPGGARVGTSSLRRAAQLRHLRPDLELVPLRGNVRTRLAKLQTSDLDAIVLARAGLERLGLSEMISVIFDPKQFIPAPAQGALAVQTRNDDRETIALVRALDEEMSKTLASAERQVLVTINCGCHAPAGAYAEANEGVIEMHAFISDVQGRNIITREASGPLTQGLQLGEQLARELLDDGGRQILRGIDDL
jgi:hydroxymethylbilane synthase